MSSEFPNQEGKESKIRLDIEYDGTLYHGWQVQPNKQTIQSVIEDRLATILRQERRVAGAGRTDAGVHAKGQVAHFTITGRIDLLKLRRSLNALLPPDIRIRDVTEVPLSFHARKSAKSKIYRYFIYQGEYLPPFFRRYVYLYPHPLDINRMNQVVSSLVGTRDFSSFMASDSNARDTIKTVFRAEIKRAELFNDIYIFEIEGDGFLKHMVRTIVGTLLSVEKGKMTPQEFQDAIEKGDRSLMGETMPPQGLFLWKVVY